MFGVWVCFFFICFVCLFFRVLGVLELLAFCFFWVFGFSDLGSFFVVVLCLGCYVVGVLCVLFGFWVLGLLGVWVCRCVGVCFVFGFWVFRFFGF